MRKNTEARLRRAVARRDLACNGPESDTAEQTWEWLVECGEAPVIHHVISCTYCHEIGTMTWPRGGEPKFTIGGVPAHLDHVIPESKNGPTSLDNTVIACAPCNMAKGDSALGDPDFQSYVYRKQTAYFDKLAEQRAAMLSENPFA